jgi:hypothetical protein
MHTLSIGSAPGTTSDKLLAAISEETGGLHQHTCVPQVELEGFLANSLVEALKGNTVELVGYETGTLLSNPSGEHHFPINGSATRAAFLLSWSGGTGEDLILHVFAPDGRELPTDLTGVSFARTALRFPLFLGGRDPEAFAGTWRVVVERRKPGNAPILYRTYLLVDDAALEYDLTVRPSLLKPGLPLLLRARVTESSRAVRPKMVRATVQRPRVAVGDLVRQSKVTDADRARIARQLNQRELLVSPVAATWEAVFRNPKNAPALQPIVDQVELFDDGRPEHGDDRPGDGIYNALYRETKVPGEYQVEFEIAGESRLNGSFKRTRTASATVAIREVPETRVDVKLAHCFWRRGAKVSVTLAPQDRSGIWLGPGYADRIQVSIQGGKPQGPVLDRLDGTYTQDLWVPRVKDLKEVEVRVLETTVRVPVVVR